MDSTDRTFPVPSQCGHGSVYWWMRLGRTRCRVIWTMPSSPMGNTLLRARSRDRTFLSSWTTFSRFDSLAMSMKSMTMMPRCRAA